MDRFIVFAPFFSGLHLRMEIRFRQLRIGIWFYRPAERRRPCSAIRGATNAVRTLPTMGIAWRMVHRRSSGNATVLGEGHQYEEDIEWPPRQGGHGLQEVGPHILVQAIPQNLLFDAFHEAPFLIRAGHFVPCTLPICRHVVTAFRHPALRIGTTLHPRPGGRGNKDVGQDDQTGYQKLLF